MTAGPLTLEDLERLDRKAREFYRLGLTHGGMADDVLRLTAALRSVMAERDGLRALCDRAREARTKQAAAQAAYDHFHATSKRKHAEGLAYQLDDDLEAAQAEWRAAIEALGPGGEK